MQMPWYKGLVVQSMYKKKLLFKYILGYSCGGHLHKNLVFAMECQHNVPLIQGSNCHLREASQDLPPSKWPKPRTEGQACAPLLGLLGCSMDV